MTTDEHLARAHKYFGGQHFAFADLNTLWRELKRAHELGAARRVLEFIRLGLNITGKGPDAAVRRELCQQAALLTSKDLDLPAATRHDAAIKLLDEVFGPLEGPNPALDRDSETLGILGGIYKRRWNDLGQLKDLRNAAWFYARGARGEMGDDAYPHINAAFMFEQLAHAGDAREENLVRAAKLRKEIIENLPPSTSWFNAATRAEALFAVRRYGEAQAVVQEFLVAHDMSLWELETTARQIAAIACLQHERPLDVPEIRAFFETLLPKASSAIQSVTVGKVGLALSGGGFRASFYHLGVLARLAELNVLRHVDVLSCVSGGSIVGALYWLALRGRMLKGPLRHEDYLTLVEEVIATFCKAVATDVRGEPSKLGAFWRLLHNEKGALDAEKVATALEEKLYRPLLPGPNQNCMHDLPFTPADHDPGLTRSAQFHPGKHNWLRANKVPVLVLNATTVNTGHAWQFTPTWMGESPWGIHEAADSIPRYEWAWYAPEAGWRMSLSRAVAASASVPGVFAPLQIGNAYDGHVVRLVDGGVHDNQGTVSLLGLDCNVVLVSDACGQLLLENDVAPGVAGLLKYAARSMDTLMERIRLANYGDLAARKQTGLLRALMFLHMKAGLDADTVRLRFSNDSYALHRQPFSPAGIRKEFQQALAELRTDLDVFTEDESNALMACGYQMATWAIERDLSTLKGLTDEPRYAHWRFLPTRDEITSDKASTPRRKPLLEALKQGSKVRP